MVKGKKQQLPELPSGARIELVDLETIQQWPANPKRHDIAGISQSVRRHGFIEPMIRDDATGRLVAGHGRLEALQLMRKDQQAPPPGVVLKNGRWFVPVLVGVRFENELEAEAYLLADNRLEEIGGWMREELQRALWEQLAAERLDGTGFRETEARDLLQEARRSSPEGELDVEAAGIRQWSIQFGVEEYTAIVGRLDRAMTELEQTNHTDAFREMLRRYERA